MIASDQPTGFPDDVVVRVSSRDDGTMFDRDSGHRHHPEVVRRREGFTAAQSVDYKDTVYQVISYDDTRTYDKISDVSSAHVTATSEGVDADVLYTETPGVGLFLPIADCIGAVLYDPRRRALALAHIGRHASLADAMTKVVQHFIAKGSHASDILVWMSPSVGKDSYRMEYFTGQDDPRWNGYYAKKAGGIYLDLRGFNRSRAIAAGVKPEHIEISSVDTATDTNYFSHSQGDTTGRFAVLAIVQP